jgi:hypothetical protein
MSCAIPCRLPLENERATCLSGLAGCLVAPEQAAEQVNHRYSFQKARHTTSKDERPSSVARHDKRPQTLACFRSLTAYPSALRRGFSPSRRASSLSVFLCNNRAMVVNAASVASLWRSTRLLVLQCYSSSPRILKPLRFCK